jgi:AcrR family transcriptional regulator
MSPGTMTRREATRARLLQAALELFAQQGYDATTAAQIAAAAGVTEMTFFRHFPSKAALVIDDPYDPLMAAAVARQPRDLAALTRLARGVREAWQEVPPPAAEQVRVRLRIAASSPSLRGAMWRGTAESERVLAEQLVTDGTDEGVARIAASATLSALMTALLVWAESDHPDLSHAITTALDVLEHHS